MMSNATFASKEQCLLTEKILSEQAQDLQDVLDNIPKESINFFMNTPEKNNTEFLTKIINLTIQMTHLKILRSLNSSKILLLHSLARQVLMGYEYS